MFRQRISTRKIICTILWDRHILMVKFMSWVNNNSCCLLWNAEEKWNAEYAIAIQNKRHGVLTFGILLLHYMLSHIEQHTLHRLYGNIWLTPSHNLDLTSSDFHVFLTIRSSTVNNFLIKMMNCTIIYV